MKTAKTGEGAIHKGHRLRVKSLFKENGISTMNDHQLLEFMLFFAVPNGDTNPTAHRLIERFGSFERVLEADIGELTEVDGIGDHAAVLIKLFQQVAGRYLVCSCLCPQTKIEDTETLVKFFVGVFLGKPDEEFYAMAVDDELRVMKTEKLADGFPNSVNVSFNMVARFAVKNNCTRIVIAHNHPNGAGRPSRYDIVSTRELAGLLDKMCITLIDHIIVGKTGGWSMLSGLSAGKEAALSLKEIFEREEKS